MSGGPTKSWCLNWTADHLWDADAKIKAKADQFAKEFSSHLKQADAPGGTQFSGQLKDAAVNQAQAGVDVSKQLAGVKDQARTVVTNAAHEGEARQRMVANAIGAAERDGYTVLEDISKEPCVLDTKPCSNQSESDHRALAAETHSRTIKQYANDLWATDQGVETKLTALATQMQNHQFPAPGAPQPPDASTKPDPVSTNAASVGLLNDSLGRMDPSILAKQTHVEWVPGVDPNSPDGKAAIAAIRSTGQKMGLPADQVEARVQDAINGRYAVKFANPDDNVNRAPSGDLHGLGKDDFNQFMNRGQEGFYKALDGTVQEGKNLAGVGGPGQPGVAESWKDLATGTGKALLDQASNPLGNVANIATDQAHEFVKDPADFTGKKAFEAVAAAPTLGLGGEGAALNDARALAAHGLEDAGPGVSHTPIDVGHHAPPGDGLTHINTESGGTGAWNHDLNNPQPNHHYNVDNQFNYNTDNLSRVDHAHADLDSGSADRNGYQQRIAGGPDRLPGDQGGHIFGTQFGGPGEAINLTAMRDTLNNVGSRDYYNLEMQWKNMIDQGKQISVEVDISYPGESMRPDMYSVKTYVDGKLDSTHGFRN